jgi:type IV pilus assembly protein PilC
MPKFQYTAIDINNKKVKDFCSARDDEDLRRILRGRGLVLTKYNSMDDKRSSYRLKAGECAEFSRQLASMLGSGITLIRTLEILKDRDFKPRLTAIYARLHRDIQKGHTLSEAMKLQPGAFPELLINMYASGEASGQIEQVAEKMALMYDREHKLNKKVKSAMTYPVVLMAVTLIVVMLIFTVVLPQFFELFEDAPLPTVTQVTLGISKFLQSNWYWVVIAVFVIAFALRLLLRIWRIALFYDRYKLSIPVVGKLIKIIYTARFARTLSSLYSSGISMIRALEIGSTIVGNKYIQVQFDDVIKNVRNGVPLSESIGNVIGFDKKLTTSILIGEESGNLDTMLEATAESFDYEAEMATTGLVQIIEPLLIVMMAVVICGIMLSVMLPLLTLYQSVGNM